MTHRHGYFVVMAFCVAACSGAGVIAGPVDAGVWGSTQGNLTVYADSATLDLACAAGRLPSTLVADSTGTFDVAGFYAAEVGPVSINGPDWQPARYRGTRTGDDLSISVTLSTGATIGPLRFHRGTVGQFARCL